MKQHTDTQSYIKQLWKSSAKPTRDEDSKAADQEEMAGKTHGSVQS